MKKGKIILMFLLSFLVVGIMLFVPAGSFSYWQAWLFMAALFIPAIFIVVYFIKKDPGLLERRMKFKEKEARQKWIVKLTNILFFFGFLVPGLDYRFGWSNVPLFLVILSQVFIVLGYLLVFFVFRENSYTSRTVEVYKGQKLVSTGPYSIVRHPMYSGVILMYLFMPLALGSYIALVFFAPIIIAIIFRIFNEEKVLARDLKGYKEYMKKVKYRLIPKIW